MSYSFHALRELY